MTRDPELRRTLQGDAVTSFTLAVNRNFTSRDGQQQADFINCVVWRKSAENVERYCSKGSLVGVEGRIQTRSYENSQGQKKYTVEVICDVVQFMGTRAVNEEQSKKDIYQTDYNENSLLRDLEKEFDNSLNTFEISEDDLPF
jgi:single-strand DNA-binding protein